MDEVKEHFDKRIAEVKGDFARLEERFDTSTAEMKADFHQEAADTSRHFDVVAEGLRTDIQLVAEGVTLAHQRIDGLKDEVHQMGRELRSEIRLVAGSQAELRTRVDRLESKPTT